MPMHRHGADDIILAFPTPVLARVMRGKQSFNERLRDIILKHADEDVGVGASNVGGWHSEPDLFTWPYPEVRELMQWVGKAIGRMARFTSDQEDAIGEFNAVGWANVLGAGAYNIPHTHPDCMWSGVYYVDVGTKPESSPSSGMIEFIDPRTAVDNSSMPGDPFAGKLSFDPEPGLMIIFPSWLYHYVHPYHGRGRRVSISFNARLSDTHHPKTD